MFSGLLQRQVRNMTSSILAPASKFKLALIQLATSSDKQTNLQRARDKVLEAAKNGANVVVLPVKNRGTINTRRKKTKGRYMLMEYDI